MRDLDQALVEEVWDTLAAYPPDRSQTEARAFLTRQPHLVALAETLTEEFDVEVRKAALGLLFLLVKIVEAQREAPVPSLSRGKVARAHAAALAWMERWDGADERFLARSGEFPQPHLIPYLITGFYAAAGDSLEHEAEVKGALFLLLKSAADALADPEDAGPPDEPAGDAGD